MFTIVIKKKNQYIIFLGDKEHPFLNLCKNSLDLAIFYKHTDLRR